MKEFLAQEEDFIDALAQRHMARRLEQDECAHCSLPPAAFRCINCHHPHLLCRNCIRQVHHHQPFHRIEKWNGSFFSPTTLKECGLIVSLGHDGELCPHHSIDRPFIEVTVLDTNGLHKTAICYCHCARRTPPLCQLLNMGFWPATVKQPTMLFTYDLLQDYHDHTLTSHKSAWDYWRTLCRKTNPFFPDKVPVSRSRLSCMPINVPFKNVYSQFLRCTRFFHYISALFQSGQGFSIDKHLNTQRRQGLISMPCLACPEPGFNMPDGWEDTPEHMR